MTEQDEHCFEAMKKWILLVDDCAEPYRRKHPVVFLTEVKGAHYATRGKYAGGPKIPRTYCGEFVLFVLAR